MHPARPVSSAKDVACRASTTAVGSESTLRAAKKWYKHERNIANVATGGGVSSLKLIYILSSLKAALEINDMSVSPNIHSGYNLRLVAYKLP